MCYGFTESESFLDPTILNQFKQHKVVIEKREGNKGFWHIVIILIKDKDISQAIGKISSALKPDWNAMFYNDKILYAVFKDKIFDLKMRDTWKLSDYEEVKKHAKACDVGDLDMNEVFKHYQKLLSN
jgi:hypothetical protein